MERLTFEGNFCDIAQCRELPCKYDGNCTQKQVWERLKDYEDAGLSPQACAEAREIEETLSSYDYSISRMVELMKADKEGRLVVLPCKVGDTVYFALIGRIIEKQVFSIVSFSNSTRIYCGGTSEYFRPEDIGKTFFLAREEAEKALQEMEGKEEGCDE